MHKFRTKHPPKKGHYFTFSVQKGLRFEKSTSAPVVAVVTNISYGYTYYSCNSCFIYNCQKKIKGHSLDFSFCSLPWSLWHSNWKVDQNNFFCKKVKVNTNLHRHTGLNKSISGSLVANNILWFLHRFYLNPSFSSQDHPTAFRIMIQTWCA